MLDRLTELRRRGARAALATVVRVVGSAYRHEGAKLLVAEDGGTTGNVSGGCLEQDVREVALQVIRSGACCLRNYCSGTDEVEAWDLGLGCEGRVDVFIEPALEVRSRERALVDGRDAFAVGTVVDAKREEEKGNRVVVTRDSIMGELGTPEVTGKAAAWAREALEAERSGLREIAGRLVFCDVFLPPPQLVLCGAGEDAAPLARLAGDVGFRVVVVDRRAAHLRADRFPGAARLVETDAAGLASAVALDDSCYAVVMTHNFAEDQGYLQALLATSTAYIGMLGPKQRTERILRDLSTAAPRDATRVYGPVGLDIGTDGPEQVALSVVAEILAIRSGRLPKSLRERSASIHAPAD